MLQSDPVHDITSSRVWFISARMFPSEIELKGEVSAEAEGFQCQIDLRAEDGALRIAEVEDPGVFFFFRFFVRNIKNQKVGNHSCHSWLSFCEQLQSTQQDICDSFFCEKKQIFQQHVLS